MQSPFYFIVKAVNGKRYDNTKEIAGVDLIVSTSEEDHRFSNRKAEVVSLPLRYEGPIRVGDTLIVHHNVFKFYNDIRGRQRSGRSFLKDDLFFVDNDQFFLFGRGGEWFTHDRYCFVGPIPSEDSFLNNYASEEGLMGIMIYPNDMLKSRGVKEGDKVSFCPDSKYEFNIDGRKLYRIFDHQITAVI